MNLHVVKYLYHNSSARNLDSIKKEGLSNKYDGGYNHGNKDIPDEKPRIYFAEDIKRATSFGGGSNTIPELRPLTFRVKKSVLGGDIYKAEKLSGGETWYFGKDIKPSDLEVFENGKWKKLSTGKSSELSKSQLEEIWNKANKKVVTDPLLDEAKKYKNVEDFIKTKTFRDGHVSPGFDDTPLKKRLEDGGDFNMKEVASGKRNQPKDYFDPIGKRYYMYDDVAGMESYTAINNIIRAIKSGNLKGQTVTVYRTIPKEIKVTKLVDRDWVSPSKTYAINHGESRFGKGEYKLIKQEVKPEELWWDGNDIREWGYDTGKTKQLSRYELIAIWNKANKK